MARRLSVRHALAGLGLVALAPLCALGAGCDVITGGCGDELRAEPPVTYSDGTVEGGIYQSSTWDKTDWIDFPPGITVRFEHQLGEVPRAWQAYVSTSRDDKDLVLASGSEVELVDIDSEVVAVTNSTCVELFVMMVAMTSVGAPG